MGTDQFGWNRHYLLCECKISLRIVIIHLITSIYTSHHTNKRGPLNAEKPPFVIIMLEIHISTYPLFIGEQHCEAALLSSRSLSINPKCLLL